jgi:hypothetical protein
MKKAVERGRVAIKASALGLPLMATAPLVPWHGEAGTTRAPRKPSTTAPDTQEANRRECFAQHEAPDEFPSACPATRQRRKSTSMATGYRTTRTVPRARQRTCGSESRAVFIRSTLVEDQLSYSNLPATAKAAWYVRARRNRF